MRLDVYSHVMPLNESSGAPVRRIAINRRMTDDFPEDPFELKLPGLENAPEDVRKLVRGLASAKYDYSALRHQQSFRELPAAVAALNEDQARAVLPRAIMVSVHRHMIEQMHDPQRFTLWLQAP